MPTEIEREKLWSMIRDIEVAMMTTEDGDVLRSRPMVASQKEYRDTLWFFTRASSHKVTEVQEHSRVNLSYSNPPKQLYVSISGTTRLSRDPAQINEHWSESLKVWFPKGQDDPDIALLHVDVTQAEFWDAPSSAMLHAYGYVKAVLTGQSPTPGGHGKVMG